MIVTGIGLGDAGQARTRGVLLNAFDRIYLKSEFTGLLTSGTLEEFAPG